MFSLTVSSRTRKRKALSRFVSASGEKGHPYFQCLRRNNKFAWTKECEEAFVKLKEYLASPPVLCKPLVGTPLKLYFVVTERAVSAVLAQDQDQAQKFSLLSPSTCLSEEPGDLPQMLSASSEFLESPSSAYSPCLNWRA